jgi:hypothetical protein
MNIEQMKDWITILGLGGVVGTVITLIVKAILERKSQEYRHDWQQRRERHEKRVETDRATYNQRLTILVRENLAAFVRSGKWFSDEADLRRLILSLGQGTHEHFLDPHVNRLWEALVAKSAELAAKRLAIGISELEVREYNRVRNDWEDAAKRSFGPLPATPALSPRTAPRDLDGSTKEIA